MGHRANFVLIRDAEAKAYYDQWAALGCTYAFAGGPPRWAGWQLFGDDRGVDAFAEHLARRTIASVTTRPKAHPEDCVQESLKA